jgi:hypothetical protein
VFCTTESRIGKKKVSVAVGNGRYLSAKRFITQSSFFEEYHVNYDGIVATFISERRILSEE